MSQCTNTITTLMPVTILFRSSICETMNEDDKNENIKTLFFAMLYILAAGYLSWSCNKNATLGVKIFYTVIAAFFGGFYILYYAIIYGLFNGKCDVGNNN